MFGLGLMTLIFVFLVYHLATVYVSLLYIAPGWWNSRKLYTAYSPCINLYITSNLFFLSESDGFKPVSHREIVISARLLVTNLKH